MVYKHAVVAAFRIYAQHGEDAAKREVGGRALNSHGNYIFYHGKSWKNHQIVFWNFCGNLVLCLDSEIRKSFHYWALEPTLNLSHSSNLEIYLSEEYIGESKI